MHGAANIVAFDLAARFDETFGMNAFVVRRLKAIEMIGVLMRIFSFSLVSCFGAKSPFMFVWIFNSVDAVMLTWCSTIKRDNAYVLLNAFWILVGPVGILRAGNILHYERDHWAAETDVACISFAVEPSLEFGVWPVYLSSRRST